MRLPFLILCVAVVYGSCLPYDVAEIQNGDLLNISDMPFERFHSRHKRNLLSPITAPLDMALRLCGLSDGVISTSVGLTKFIFGALLGTEPCPKVEKLSLFKTIPQMIMHPFDATKTITCYFFQEIGSEGRALMAKTIDLSIQFTKNVFLPGLHTTLNALKDTNLLPAQIVVIIEAFNAIYKIAQMLGYLPK